MRKVPTLFRRDPDDMRRVLPEVTPGCEWVLAGEGVPTRKYDGTCVMRDDTGDWWARREVKPGKAAPPNFWPLVTDEATGKTIGWEPIAQSPFAKFHAEALTQPTVDFPGTYELCGPKINGNPEGFYTHTLVRHADAEVIEPRRYEPLTYETLREFMLDLRAAGVEGIVWHHPDGLMAKLKARDFQGAP